MSIPALFHFKPSAMKSLLAIQPSASVAILRVAIGLFLAAHGGIRLFTGSVHLFGGYLDSQGFMIGNAIAWFLTLFELIGGLTMAVGFFIPYIAIIFMIELTMGIIMVHAQNGWFVVGYQSGGVEYSVFLLVCLFIIATCKR